MTRLTPEADDMVREIASRYGVSAGAVETLLVAVARGNGMQAQFNHGELGGMGQWSQGGMTMIGDMFNNGLKATVNALCTELSQIVTSRNVFAPAPTGSQSQSNGPGLFVDGSGQSSWPADLGAPSSTGAQNSMRYGVFPDRRRLAVEVAGRMEIYDTGDHRISGVSQQQSGDQSLTFTSQHGPVRLADLPKVTLDPDENASRNDRDATPPAPEAPRMQQHASPSPMPAPVRSDVTASTAGEAASDSASDTIIALIRKLADLKESGILTETEFETKKSELLSRL